ncbi:hypothetical protein IC582_026535 [Cucumis melo]|uniref:Uncharacterized protein LOC103496264 n=1 Tax=Cucumis melo TaxID=3656 RepID=A0A1S3C2U0_CUCME|nr:uncharacterized protein LOC103496264 [Cucumis melo]
MSLPWWISATAVPFPSQTQLISHPCHHQHHIRLRKLSSSPSTSTAPRAVLLDEIVQLTHNKVLIAAGVSAAIGQLAKPFTSVVFYGREFNIRTAFEAGGFPSTHSSAVVAAATILGAERGLADSIFGITVVYASLIMYDAQGVRREVGKHAKALNKLSQTERPMNSSSPYKDQDLRVDSQFEKRISLSLNRNLEIGNPILSEESTKALTVPSPVKQDVTSSSVANDLEEGSIKEASSSWKPFKESIGHTEIEVAAGALLGFTVSLITNSFL